MPDGIFDKYTYEVMFIRSTPTMEGATVSIENEMKKVYLDEISNESLNVDVNIKIPAIHKDANAGVDLVPQVNSARYVFVPYDSNNKDFAIEDISSAEFNRLYNSGQYKTGELLDSPVVGQNNEVNVTKSVQVSDNGRLYVMVEDKVYDKVSHSFASYTYSNFYTQASVEHRGLGELDATNYETLYDATDEGVNKVMVEGDSSALYGIALDAQGEVIQQPYYGFDSVSFKALDPLPNDGLKYWTLKNGADKSVQYTLNQSQDINYTYSFYYERYTDNWVNVEYVGIDKNTNEIIEDFKVEGNNPDYVKKDQLTSKAVPKIKGYDALNYGVDGEMKEFVNDQIELSPHSDTKVSVYYGKAKINTTKVVEDANKDGVASPSEELHYTITVSNNGTSKAQQITVQDTLETLLDYVDAPYDNIVRISNGTQVSVQELMNGILVDLDVKESLEFKFTLKLKKDLDTDKVSSIRNEVKVEGEEVRVEIPTGKAEISGTKSVKDENEDGFASPSEILEYTITASNNGDAKANDVLIQDTMGNLLDKIESKDVEVLLYANNSVSTYTLDDLIKGIAVDLEPDETVKVVFEVQVAKDLDVKVHPEISNTVTLGEIPVEEIIKTGSSDLSSSSKTVSDANSNQFAERGEILTYTIKVKNSGTVEAENVLIQDTLEDVLKYVEDVSKVKVSVKGHPSIKSMSLKDLMNGTRMSINANSEVELSFEVKVKETLEIKQEQWIHNQARVGDVKLEAKIITGEYDLSEAQKTVVDANKNGFAEQGEKLFYTIKVKNTGTVDAKDVEIQDELNQVLPYLQDASQTQVLIDNGGISSSVPLGELIKGLTLDIKKDTEAILSFEVTVRQDLDLDKVDKILNIATVNNYELKAEIPTGKSNFTSSVKEVVDDNLNGYAEPGEYLHYRIFVINSGLVDAEGISVQDTLEEASAFIETDGVVVTLKDDKTGEVLNALPIEELISGMVLDVPAGARLTLNFSVKVKDTLDTKLVESINNTALVNGIELKASKPTASYDLAQSSKTVLDENENGYAEANETLRYTITSTNSGKVKASDVVIQDTLEDILDFIQEDEQAKLTLKQGDQEVTYTLEDLIKGDIKVHLKPGEAVELVFDVTVIDDLDVKAVEVLHNTARVGSQLVSADIPTGSTDLSSSRKMVRDSNGDKIAAYNEVLYYTIEVNNTGLVGKDGIIVQDELSELLDLVENIDTQDMSIKIGNKTVKGKLSDLMDGISIDLKAQETAEITFAVKLISGFDLDAIPTITNIARVDGEELRASIDTGNPQPFAKKEVVDENGDGYAQPGEKLTYVITAENQGDATLSNIQVVDAMKEMIDHIESLENCTVHYVFTPEGDETSVEEGDFKAQYLVEGFDVSMDPEDEFTMTFTVEMKDEDAFEDEAPEIIENIAKVGDIQLLADIPFGDVNLSSSKSVVDANGDGFAEADEVLTYTIEVENKGEVSAIGVKVQDTLEFIEEHIENLDDVKVKVTDSNGQREESIANLMSNDGIKLDIAAGASASVVFSVQLGDLEGVESLKNIALVDNVPTEPVEIITGKAELSMNKSVLDSNGNNHAEAGETLFYTITFENKGTVSARDVQVMDELADLMEHLDPSFVNKVVSVVSNQGVAFTQSLKDFATQGFKVDVKAGEKYTVTFSVDIKADISLLNDLQLHNVALVGQLDDRATIPVGKEDLVLDKNVTDENFNQYAEPSEILNYTITLSNQGQVDAKNVEIKDALSGVIGHLQDVYKVSVNEYDGDELIGSFIIQDLINGIKRDVKVGQTLTYNFDVQLKDDFDTKATPVLSNTVVVNESLTASASIQTGYLELTQSSKTVSDANANGYAEAEEVLSYVIEVINSGSIESQSVTVKDDLQGLLPYVELLGEVEVIKGSETSTMPYEELMNGFEMAIDAGETVQYAFDVKVNEDIDTEDVKLLRNIATVNDEKLLAEIPTGYADFSNSSKSVSDANKDGVAAPYEVLSYRIDVVNDGNMPQTTMIQDTLSDIMEHLDATYETVVTLNVSNNKTQYTLEQLVQGIELTLEGNSSAELTFDVRVSEAVDVDDVTELTNIAKVGNQEVSASIPTGKANLMDSTKAVSDANGNDYIEPGELVYYSIEVVNNGDANLEGVLVKDTLSEIIDAIESTDALVSVNTNNEGVLDVHTLQDLIRGIEVDVKADHTTTLTFSVRAKDDLDVKQVPVFRNTATINDLSVSATRATGDVDLSQSSKQVSDASSDGKAEAGEKLTYSIIVKNTGLIDAKGVWVQDTLDNILDYINDPSDLEMSMTTNQEEPVSMKLQKLMDGMSLNINSGEYVTLSFTVTVKDDLDTDAVKAIANIATVGKEEVEVEVPTGKADLSNSSKTVVDANKNGYAEPKETLDYTITVSNTGDVDAVDVLVKDTLEQVLAYVDAPYDNAVKVQGSSDAYTVKDLIDGFKIDVEAGSECVITFSVVVKEDIDLDKVESIGNIATLNEEEVKVEIPTGDSNITDLTKTVVDESKDGFAVAGEVLHYTITAKNTGNLKAYNVLIKDTLEDIEAYLGDLDTAVVTVDNEETVKEYTIAQLQAGIYVDIDADASVTVRFSVTLKEDFNTQEVVSLRNIALVGDEPVEVEIPSGQYDLSDSYKTVVDQNGNGIAEPGEELTYTIHVVNTGEVDANDIPVQDTLEDLQTAMDPELNEDILVLVVENGVGRLITLDELIQGTSVNVAKDTTTSLTFKVRLRQDLDAKIHNTIKNIAVIDEDEDVEIEIPVDDSDYGNSKKEVFDASQDGLAQAGETLRYVISVLNTGETIGNEFVQVKDTLSEIKDYLVDLDQVEVLVQSPSMGTLKYSLNELIEGIDVSTRSKEMVTISFEVEVVSDLDVTKVSSLDNMATVGTLELHASINTGAIDLSGSQKHVYDDNRNGIAEPGENLHYEITVSNTGTVKAENILVSDDLKDMKDYLEDLDVIVTVQDANGKNTTTLKALMSGIEVDVDAGSEATVSFSVKLKDTLNIDTVDMIRNTVVIKDEEIIEEIPTGEQDLSGSYKDVVDANQDGFASPGESLVYTLYLVNSGDVDSKDVFVQDALTQVLPYVRDVSGTQVKITDDKNQVTMKSIEALIAGFTLDVAKESTVKVSFEVVVKDDLDTDEVQSIANIAVIENKNQPGEPDIDIDVEVPTLKAQLSVVKSVIDENGDDKAEAGELLTYVIKISNESEFAAPYISVKDSMEGLLAFTNASDNQEVILRTADKDEVLSLGELMKGTHISLDALETAELIFNVKVNKDFDYTETDVLSNTVEVNDQTAVASIVTGGIITTMKKFVIDEGEDGFATPGELLHYELLVENKGNINAEGDLVQDTLSTLMDHIDYTGQELVTVSNGSKVYNHTLEELVNGLYLDVAANSTVSVAFSVTLRKDLDTDQVSSIYNIASMDDEEVRVEIPTGRVEIVGGKSVRDANNDGKASLGEIITYTLTASNKGNMTAVDVLIIDTLEDILEYIDTPDKGRVSVKFKDSKKVYTIAELIEGFNIDIEAGETVEIEFEVKIRENLNVEKGMTLKNIAQIGSDTPGVNLPMDEPQDVILPATGISDKSYFMEVSMIVLGFIIVMFKKKEEQGNS